MPVLVDVGSFAGPIGDGPADPAAAPLGNQRIWHHDGDEVDLEVLWPVTPAVVAAHDDLTFLAEEGVSIIDSYVLMEGESLPEEMQASTVVVVGQDLTDPCATAEIRVTGKAVVVDQWMNALSFQGSHGMPLSVADVEPVEQNNPTTGPAFEETTELVGAVVEFESTPTIPETGSCDGLPDAPPQTGPGIDGVFPTPVEALDAFIGTGPHGDPPISSTGYSEIVVDGETVAFAMLWDDVAYTVVRVAQDAGGWTVDGWTGAAC